MKRLIFILTAIFVFVAGSAFAITYTIEDNWIDFPGYPTGYGDTIGTPLIDSMEVTVNDETQNLTSIAVYFETSTRQLFDSLFINNTFATDSWDDWDYTVHAGGTANSNYTLGAVPTDGLYTVASDYSYTMTKLGYPSSRPNSPNGIDANSLTIMDGLFAPTFAADGSMYKLLYDFEAAGINIDASGGLFVAYTPWCANDVIGGAPVPEPATLLLLGSGILGLGFYRRFKK